MAWDAARIIELEGLVREAERQAAHGQHHVAQPIAGWIGTSEFGKYVRCPELHRLDQDQSDAMRPHQAVRGVRVHGRWSRRASAKARWARTAALAVAVLAAAVTAWLVRGGP